LEIKMDKRIKLTAKEQKLHGEACAFARQLNEAEHGLCRVLREIDQDKFYRNLGYARTFYYAVHELKLAPAVANTTITVARKTREIPSLRTVVDEGRLSVSKASRLVSGLAKENANEVIVFALTHTPNEFNEEMARRNPEKPRRDHNRPFGNDKVEIRAQISTATNKKLKRVESLLASKGKATSLDGVLEVALDFYLDHHDPVRKAQRAQARAAQRAERKTVRHEQKSARSEQHSPASNQKTTKAERKAAVVTEPAVPAKDCATGVNANCQPEEVCVNRTTNATSSRLDFRRGDTPSTHRHRGSKRGTQRRKTIKAKTHHTVMLRTGGQCTFVNERGERCTEDRFLHLHHIVPLYQGGSDDPSNLTCLCSAHHALVHQLSLAIEGHIAWLRSPQVAYLA
jgi:hypothetical protein